MSTSSLKYGINNVVSNQEEEYSSTADLSMWFDVEKKDDATKIDLGQVKNIEMEENFFTSLPRLFFTIMDGGTYYDDTRLYIGRKVFVSISVGTKQSDGKDVLTRVSRFSIERVDRELDQNGVSGLYKITCIYDAPDYLTRIVGYPTDVIEGVSKCSSDTIRDICDRCGIGFATDLSSTNDSMVYVNNILTGKKFIEKIVNHAWVGENDAPLFYVDLDGIAHYTSIRTLCKSTEQYTFMNNLRLNELKGQSDFDSIYEETLEPNSTIVYDNAKEINLGSQIDMVNGCGRFVHVYDPYYEVRDELTLLENASTPDIRNNDLTAGTCNEHVKYETMVLESLLASNSNRSLDTFINVNRSESNGLSSLNTHYFYDIAPSHNSVYRSAFFQDFWKLSISTSQQMSYFYKKDHLPRLGDRVYVNFTKTETENEILSGGYIITRIQHVWSPHNAYALVVTVVSDGYNDKTE